MQAVLKDCFTWFKECEALLCCGQEARAPAEWVLTALNASKSQRYCTGSENLNIYYILETPAFLETHISVELKQLMKNIKN